MIPATLLACAPNVAPATLEVVISVEGGGNPFALHVNELREQPRPTRARRVPLSTSSLCCTVSDNFS
jgi:hypothetical protein